LRGGRVAPEVALFALCDISIGDELTFDYGKEESEDVHSEQDQLKIPSLKGKPRKPCFCGGNELPKMVALKLRF